MAERIVSPGVFTREQDLSFLPQGISEIGAAIIGPTKKGPAFTPTQVTSFQDFEAMFGGMDSRFYTPYTVEQYLKSAGVVTVVRVLGLGGYTVDTVALGAHLPTVGAATMSLAIIAPSRGGSGTADLSGTTFIGQAFNADGATLSVSGSSGFDSGAETYTISFNTGSEATYITKVLSSDPQVTKKGSSTQSIYVYKNFKQNQQSGSWSTTSGDNVANTASASAVLSSNGNDFASGNAPTYDSNGNATTDWTGNVDYCSARTPWISSQMVGGTRHRLFRVYTRSHGTDVNKEYKLAILNVKRAADIAGSDYGTFSLQVRSNNPNDDVTRADDNTILDQWENCTFDPNSVNFFAKLIGDRHLVIDSNGKLTYYGDYPNLSKHIRVGDYTNPANSSGGTHLESLPKSVVPMGFEAVYNTVAGTTLVPPAIFKTAQSGSGEGYTGTSTFDSTIFYGWDFDHEDSKQYLGPIPSSANIGLNVTMSLENVYGHNDASALGSTYATSTDLISLTNSAIGQRKFYVPFQWGFDGYNPATPYFTGNEIATTNTQGFDCATSTSSGSIAYKRAINAVSNPDEFDINLLVTPGIIHRLHSTVTNHAINKVESRADALYVMDSAAYDDSVQTVTNTVQDMDTNYVATYYPWVQVPDSTRNNKPVWVPTSVVLPGVIAFNDKVAHEWFAPAGLNRGGLTNVLQAKTRLTHAERDELYEGRVNPIASFPGQGAVVFGQKTLQSKPSALDRVNVRRLLIALRKFIASTSRYLVFEQNTMATRNRFLNVVNPYLEQVQQNSGLSAFRVVMDDTNNTPDVIDRNQLVGQIFIQPTRTAEFIVLDFVVQPTGATFPE